MRHIIAFVSTSFKLSSYQAIKLSCVSKSFKPIQLPNTYASIP